jgi:hypothetical protein
MLQVQQSAKDSLQNSSRLLLQKGPLRYRITMTSVEVKEG